MRFDLAAEVWSDFTPPFNQPPRRYWHITEFDSRRHKILLYGGVQSGTSDPSVISGRGSITHGGSDLTASDPELRAVWSFDPATNIWTKVAPETLDPSRRTGVVSSYDPISDVLLEYGGRLEGKVGSGQVTNELWAFDLNTNRWAPLMSTHDPEKRRWGAAGAYCPCSGELFVFAGQDTFAPGPDHPDSLYEVHSDAFFVRIEDRAAFHWLGGVPLKRRNAAILELGDTVGGSPDALENVRLIDCKHPAFSQTALDVRRLGHGRWLVQFDSLAPEMISAFGGGSLVLAGRIPGKRTDVLAIASSKGCDSAAPSKAAGPTRPDPAGREVRFGKENRDYVFALGPAYPNPSSGTVSFTFTMAKEGTALIRVYDVAGRLVKTLVNGYMHAGPHNVVWDGSEDGGSRLRGVYFFRMDTGSWRSQRKVVFLEN